MVYRVVRTLDQIWLSKCCWPLHAFSFTTVSTLFKVWKRVFLYGQLTKSARKVEGLCSETFQREFRDKIYGISL